MRTKVTTREELKQIFVEILLGTTNRVTKVADNSVLNGVSYGVAAIGQKAMKDIALTETLVNPDMAYGAYLDRIADNWGVSKRFGENGSSTYVYLSANPGTIYPTGTEVSGDQGIQFTLSKETTIPDEGYAYASVKSVQIGERTNVPPLSLTKVNPKPAGHKYLINEYIATGGMNAESDEHFRNRIKEGANGIANGTLSKLEQIMMRENPIVLKLFHGGVAEDGSNILKIATTNGALLSNAELSILLDKSADYLPLSDLRIYSGIVTYGLTLKNVDYHPIDIEFRVKILNGYNSDEVRKQMQVNLSKYFDYRFYNNRGIIEWDDLFYIVKNTDGVEYISDQSFLPGSDFGISKDSLPRIRGFMMYNLDGSILSDDKGNLDPYYYPNNQDVNTQTTI